SCILSSVIAQLPPTPPCELGGRALFAWVESNHGQQAQLYHGSKNRPDHAVVHSMLQTWIRRDSGSRPSYPLHALACGAPCRLADRLAGQLSPRRKNRSLNLASGSLPAQPIFTLDRRNAAANPPPVSNCCRNVGNARNCRNSQ